MRVFCMERSRERKYSNIHKRQDIVGVENMNTIYRVIQHIAGVRGKGARYRATRYSSRNNILYTRYSRTQDIVVIEIYRYYM